VAYYQIVVVPHFVYFTFGIDFLGNNPLRKIVPPEQHSIPSFADSEKVFQLCKSVAQHHAFAFQGTLQQLQVSISRILSQCDYLFCYIILHHDFIQQRSQNF